MRKFLCVLAMVVVGLSSCKQKEENKVLLDIAVSDFDKFVSPVFEDGTVVKKVTVEKQEGKLYLVREGENDKGDCRTTRSELDEVKNGSDEFVVYMRMGGVTESCSGDGCSYCAFKASGGCECKNSTNTCNHTVSRNHGLFILK